MCVCPMYYDAFVHVYRVFGVRDDGSGWDALTVVAMRLSTGEGCVQIVAVAVAMGKGRMAR